MTDFIDKIDDIMIDEHIKIHAEVERLNQIWMNKGAETYKNLYIMAYLKKKYQEYGVKPAGNYVLPFIKEDTLEKLAANMTEDELLSDIKEIDAQIKGEKPTNALYEEANKNVLNWLNNLDFTDENDITQKGK